MTKVSITLRAQQPTNPTSLMAMVNTQSPLIVLSALFLLGDLGKPLRNVSRNCDSSKTVFTIYGRIVISHKG